MNIEGSRHERVAVVIVAYVIGFVTAFIGFGIELEDASYSKVVVQHNPQAASVITAVQDDLPVLEMTDYGLELISGEMSILLSASLAYAGNTGNDLENVHASIVSSDISPSAEYVYFCSQPTAEAASCVPYVYSVERNVTYPVTIAGERVAFAANSHSVEWGSNGPLVIANEPVDVLPQ